MDLELSIKELRQLVEKTSPALVIVVAYDNSGKESGRGSGFFIDRKGTIIINASVLKEAYSAEVFSRSARYVNIMILHKDDSLDFALIQVKAANEIPLDLDFDYDVMPGERVVVIGQSSNMKRTVSEGLVSSVEEKSSLLEIQTTKPLLSFRESKDGPLLNMSGKVIGIMSMSITESQNTDTIPRMPDYRNFKAVGISAVKEFILRPELTEQLHPAKSKIWSRWIMRMVETAAISTFIFLYSMGFTKILAMVVISIVIISAVRWLAIRLKRRL